MNTQTISGYRGIVLAVLLGALVMAASGCATGAVRHTINLESGFVPKLDTRIELATVANETGQTSGIDIAQRFTDALSEALMQEQLLGSGNSGGEQLIITSKIVEYKKGNAFKRWLLPGWGSTVLSVYCELKEGDTGNVVGTLEARRTVSIGGGYSIGAWRTIFGDVANDLAADLRAKISR